MFFFESGEPAGYRFRDQLRKRLLDVLSDGNRVWFVTDKKELTQGFELESLSYDEQPDSLFARPVQ